MSINIVWSLTNGGDSIADVIDHGDSANGANSTEKELFVRHTGANVLTNIGIYIRQYSGTYSGAFTAPNDFDEVVEWGDGATEAAFGGLQVNFLATTSYPSSGWPEYDDKDPAGGFVHRSGVGDSEANAVAIPTTAGAVASGSLQAGAAPNVRFKARVAIPADEDTVGIRQWDQVLRFNFTS